MAHEEGTQRQFTVIGRLRAGVRQPTSSIIHSLQQQLFLNQYHLTSNIRFSRPNFMIHLKTPQQQLRLLKKRILKGPGFVMDLHPWCTQYESLDLPWLISTAKSNIRCPRHYKVTHPGPMKPYMENLIGQPYAQHISHMLTNRAVEGSRPTDAAQENPQTNARGLSSPPQVKFLLNAADAKEEEGKIYVHDLLCAVNTGTDEPGSTDARTGHPGMMPTRRPRPPPLDFSYMMLLELQDFYKQKYCALAKCRRSLQEVFNVPYQLYLHLDPSHVTPIYEHTKSLKGMLDEQTLSHVTEFGANLKDALLAHVKNEIAAIEDEFIYHQQSWPLMDLSRFRDRPSVYEAYTGEPHPTHLRTVLEAFTSEIHKVPASVITKATPYNTYETYITGINLSEGYSSTGSTTKFEAEADAIYQFLRDSTNRSGYNIVDKNYPTLSRLMSELNRFNEDVNRLQWCAQRSVNMVKRIRADIVIVHGHLLRQVSPVTDLSYLNNLVRKLLSWLQVHCYAADKEFGYFKKDKLAYMCIVLQARKCKDGFIVGNSS